MADVLDGQLAFLTARQEQGAPISLVLQVRSAAPAKPQIVLERCESGKPSGSGRISVAEVTDEGFKTPVESSTGRVILTPETDGQKARDRAIWELRVQTETGGPAPVTVRVSAGIAPDVPVRQLAESTPINLPADLLNTNDARKVTLRAPRYPRLATGINRAAPRPAPNEYRGHRRGPGEPRRAVQTDDPLFDQHLAALLHQVFFQLDASDALEPVWEVEDGRPALAAVSRSAFSVAPVQTAEELWARQVCEMLLLTVYSGPANLYGGGIKDFEMTAEAFLDSGNPVLGLGYRCQDLATFGVASRGIKLPGFQIPAGSMAAHVSAKCEPAAQWFVGTEDPQVEPGAAGSKPKAATGSPHDLMTGPARMNLLPLVQKVPSYGAPAIHLFANMPARSGPLDGALDYMTLNERFSSGQPIAGTACVIGSTVLGKREFKAEHCVTVEEQKGQFVRSHSTSLLTDDGTLHRDNQNPGAHVGFALRQRPRTNQVQLFDTGGFSISGHDTTLLARKGAFHAANLDTPGTTEIESKAGQPYKGTAIFPALEEADAAPLRDTVLKLRRARPLGLARFALLRRDLAQSINPWRPQHVLEDDTLVYVSPVLGMWGPEEEQNYHISRFLWSLRQMPAADEVVGLWMLYAPTGVLAQELRRAPRGAAVLDTARSALGAQDVSRSLANATKPLHDIVVESDGSVRSLNSSGRDFGAKHPLHRLEGRGKRGDILVPMDQQFAPRRQVKGSSLPEYFRG